MVKKNVAKHARKTKPVKNIKKHEALPINLIIIIVVLALLAFVLIGLFNNGLTGKVINDPAPLKVCVFDVGETTVSMYPCETLEECEGKVDRFLNEDGITDFYDIDENSVKAVECMQIGE